MGEGGVRPRSPSRCLPAYFKALMQYCSAFIGCCLFSRSHQFSASLSFMCNLFVWLTSSSPRRLHAVPAELRATACRRVYSVPSSVLSASSPSRSARGFQGGVRFLSSLRVRRGRERLKEVTLAATFRPTAVLWSVPSPRRLVVSHQRQRRELSLRPCRHSLEEPWKRLGWRSV